jgi:hypothetical protein
MKVNAELSNYFSEMGRLGGMAKSQAKKRAARQNAKLGGWPKGRPRKMKSVNKR